MMNCRPSDPIKHMQSCKFTLALHLNKKCTILAHKYTHHSRHFHFFINRILLPFFYNNTAGFSHSSSSSHQKFCEPCSFSLNQSSRIHFLTSKYNRFLLFFIPFNRVSKKSANQSNLPRKLRACVCSLDCFVRYKIRNP